MRKMTLHLRLWKDGDPASSKDYPFEQDIIGIGRDPSNTMQLERPDISKAHARIQQTDGGLLLTDLKSRNGTFLNGLRIPPEDPCPIVAGDKVRICDFILEVAAWDKPSDVQPTAREGSSPIEEKPPMFADEGGAGQSPQADVSMVGEWEQRADVAERECERLKAQMAVEASAAREDSQRLAAAEGEIGRLRGEIGKLEAKLADFLMRPSLRQLDEPTALRRLRSVLRVVLNPVLKIMRGRILFRSEFTGATMFQDPKMESLSRQTADEWIAFFLDPELSEETVRDRLDLLCAETDEIIPHVIGLLDGYRKSIDIGTKNMLRQLDPGQLREELFEKPLKAGMFSIPYQLLPLVSDRIAWKALERRYRELEQEDRGNLEQRFFRPAFIQGYINCLNSAKHEPLRPLSNIQTSAKAQP